MLTMKIVPVKADWTNEDPEITTWLTRHKRAGVPMYLIMPAHKPDAPILLPDVLTQDALTKGFKEAGPSQKE